MPRGQTFTLEAVVAGILLLTAVAFALQVVAISANSANAGDLELRNHQAGLAEGVIANSVANGSLQSTLLYWDEDAGEFHQTDPENTHYIARSPPTAFGTQMDAMFAERRVQYNLNLYFHTQQGDRITQPVVESGTPNDNAVRVVESITLYDSTPLVNETESERTITLADVRDDVNRTFYAPDAQPNSPVYTVVRVEVVLWQT